MSNKSKRYQKAREVGDDLHQGRSLEEAVSLLQQMPSAKFDESVELSAKLLVDPRQSNQMVRGTVALPHGSGKTVRVLVFTDDPETAKAAGADYAGLEDMIAKVEGGWMDFDVAVATPAAMKDVRKIARILGPRGLMPNPKSGTVTDDIAEAIRQVKAGRVEFKMDKTANVHVVCGKKSFARDQLVENTQVVIDALKQAKPEVLHGRYVKSMTLSATMSPGIRLENEIFARM